jgi:putative FmdB family regulatory protein
MPVYDERCLACGEEFEIIVLSFSAPRPCPYCESTNTRQLVSLPNFRMGKRKFEMKRGPSHNPYDSLTLQHVRGSDGKPITVNSEAELHRAEKEHGFVHNASWGMASEPPQHEKGAGDIAKGYKRKWNRDPDAYKSPEAQKGVMTGVARNASETLAGRPNPL